LRGKGERDGEKGKAIRGGKREKVKGIRGGEREGYKGRGREKVEGKEKGRRGRGDKLTYTF